MWNLKRKVFDPIPGNNSSCLTASPRIQDRWGSFYHRKSHRHGGRGLGSIPLQWVIHCYRFRGHPWGSKRNTGDRNPGQGSLFTCFKKAPSPKQQWHERCRSELRPAFPKAGSLPGHQEKGTTDRRCALSGIGQLLSTPDLTPKTEWCPLDKGEDSGRTAGPTLPAVQAPP